jgi:integrase
MYEQAIRWGWVPTNPVKAVRKPTAKRERAVVCLAPSQVEAIRCQLVARGKLYAATMVSLVAYQGLRVPEELLALEVRHVRRNTLLIEQRNINGRVIGGQKVRGFHPRAIDLLDPVRRDVREHMLAHGIQEGLLFPRRDEAVAPSRLPELAPADMACCSLESWDRELAAVRPAPRFASLQIRAGLSIPELAEQMGHSPQMTIGTYAQVIREVKGEPVVSPEEQIEQACQESGGRLVDVDAI